MRVTVNKNKVVSDVFEDNIMKDCGLEDINFAYEEWVDLETVVEKLKDVTYGRGMFNWSFDKNQAIKPSSECENSFSEGIALTLYFKYTDEVKKRNEKAKETMKNIVSFMKSEIKPGKSIISNGLILEVISQPEGTVAFDAVRYNISDEMKVYFNKKMNGQNVLHFCLDRESGYNPEEAIVFNDKNHDINIYYSFLTKRFFIS